MPHNQQVIISNQLEKDLTNAIHQCTFDQLFVVADTTTAIKCWQKIARFEVLKQATLITIEAGEEHKTLQTVTHIWQTWQEKSATRHSLAILLGGGMVTDLGAFAASTFKRGIQFINIPTTLLAMVDASVGGKTGINFGGLKNEIGVFNEAYCVILSTLFLDTLDTENRLSGYAEMMKHGLISHQETFAQLLAFDWHTNANLNQLQSMVATSVKIKESVVVKDPFEQGLRKALNLGHTFGHAFESWSFNKKPILHGYAVAFGLVCELYLSTIKCGFPIKILRQTTQFVRENYGILPISCDDYNELIALMRHDKKNMGSEINFTLLANIGDIRIDQQATLAEIKEALDFLREGL